MYLITLYVPGNTVINMHLQQLKTYGKKFKMIKSTGTTSFLKNN